MNDWESWLENDYFTKGVTLAKSYCSKETLCFDWCFSRMYITIATVLASNPVGLDLF